MVSRKTFLETLKRLSIKSPFIFFSTVLIIYTILQLLISYHIIETEFATSTHHDYNARNIQQQQMDNNNDIHREYTTNRFEGCDPIHIDYKWGTQFNNQRIACLILSLYPRNKILMQFIGETYGKLCDGLFFILDDSKTHWFNKTLHTKTNNREYSSHHIDQNDFEHNKQIIDEDIKHIPLQHLSSYFGGTIISLNLSRPSHHLERNTWEKLHRMYTYFYINYLNDYDWFIRIDDDVLVSIVNLKYYLSFFDVNSYPYYIGHTLFDRWRHNNIVYNAGNLHVINRLTLSKLGPLFMTLPTSPTAHSAHAHCMDFIAGNDDPHQGTCLNALGIYPINTLDYQLKNRFMVFRNSDHYNIKREDSWYWKQRPFDMGQLKDCCNIFAFNDHPWIHIAAQLEWRLKFIKMDKETWNNKRYINNLRNLYLDNKSTINEVIPTFPCSFMFNIKDDLFKIDKYYNNIDYDRIPTGQRISFGDDDIMNCHKCNIGDKNDIYWTNEWDRTRLLYKINESNKHKFYEISKYFPNQLISTRFDIDENTKKFKSNDKNDDSEKLQSLIDQALDPKVTKIVPP